MDVLRAEVSQLTDRAALKRREIAAKRQMCLDWKRAVSEGWKLNKEEIEKEMEAAILKLRNVINAVTRET